MTRLEIWESYKELVAKEIERRKEKGAEAPESLDAIMESVKLIIDVEAHGLVH